MRLLVLPSVIVPSLRRLVSPVPDHYTEDASLIANDAAGRHDRRGRYVVERSAVFSAVGAEYVAITSSVRWARSRRWENLGTWPEGTGRCVAGHGDKQPGR